MFGFQVLGHGTRVLHSGDLDDMREAILHDIDEPKRSNDLPDRDQKKTTLEQLVPLPRSA